MDGTLFHFNNRSVVVLQVDTASLDNVALPPKLGAIRCLGEWWIGSLGISKCSLELSGREKLSVFITFILRVMAAWIFPRISNWNTSKIHIYIYRENPFMVGPTFLIIAFLIRNPYRPVFNCHRYWVGGRSKLYIKLLECSLNDTPVTCRLKHMIIYDISSPSQSRFYDDVRLKMKVAKKRAVELSMDCETCYSSKISNHLHTIQATD